MHYAISCGHELTAETAERILKAGGNAIDAAIGAFVTSWIVEPCMSGPGGGGFAMVRMHDKVHALDFFTQTPTQKRPARDIHFPGMEVDFGGTTEVFHYGYGSVAVPGAIDGIFALHKLGARLPMSELVRQGMEYAKGHDLVAFQHLDMTLLKEILGSADRGRELFFQDGEIKPVGSRISLPHLADFMDYMSREGRPAFYRGEVAHKITTASAEYGGHLTARDLRDYETRLIPVRRLKYAGCEVMMPHEPSIGGKVLSAILTQAEGKHSLHKAMHDVSGLKHRWFEPGWNIKEGGTSHLNVIDNDGNAVSLSMSLGEGSGCFVEGTDIHLNNMLGEAALLPNGWHSWTPDTRLKSMMTPVIATSEAEGALLVTGSGGASRIPFAIAQIIDSYFVRGREISDAVMSPRIHWDGQCWQIEPGYDRDLANDLSPTNRWDHKSLYFGGVHTSVMSHNGFDACGDDRRDGVALKSN